MIRANKINSYELIERKIAKTIFSAFVYIKSTNKDEQTKCYPKRASCRVAGQNNKNLLSLESLERGYHESNECRKSEIL